MSTLRASKNMLTALKIKSFRLTEKNVRWNLFSNEIFLISRNVVVTRIAKQWISTYISIKVNRCSKRITYHQVGLWTNVNLFHIKKNKNIWPCLRASQDILRMRYSIFVCRLSRAHSVYFICPWLNIDNWLRRTTLCYHNIPLTLIYNKPFVSVSTKV